MMARILTAGLALAAGVLVAVGATLMLARGRMLSGVLLALAAAAVIRLSAFAWKRMARS